MDEPISNENLERKRRYTARHTASVLVQMMARSDLDFNAIGKRCRRTPKFVRQALYSLIDGQSATLDVISDIALANGCEFWINAKQVPPEDLVSEPHSE